MPRILRFPLHDDNTSFVLVHVNNPSKTPSLPLDLRLIGTEGDNGYDLLRTFILRSSQQAPQSRDSCVKLTMIHKVTHNTVSSLKAKNSPCSQDEWTVILEYILLDKPVEDNQKELLGGVEAVASVDSRKSISVTLRKRIEQIIVSGI